MQCPEAMAILGLTTSQIQDEAAIIQAWTQANEAKKVLLKKLADDMKAHKKEQHKLESCEKNTKLHSGATHSRKRRTPETRVHRKIDSYPEGKELVEEMNKFFKEQLVFDRSNWNKLLVRDILKFFVTSRNATTDLETNLFKRHNKKLILTTFPDAVYSTSKNQRCFLHLDFRK
jgi:hypothetical protein